jgi:hypothetical protein
MAVVGRRDWVRRLLGVTRPAGVVSRGRSSRELVQAACLRGSLALLGMKTSADGRMATATSVRSRQAAVVTRRAEARQQADASVRPGR